MAILLVPFHNFLQVLTHKHVAVNFYLETWPSSGAMSLVFERAAADNALKDIHFAKVEFCNCQVRLSKFSFALVLTLFQDIVRSLKVKQCTVSTALESEVHETA